MILLTQADKDGNTSVCALNPKYITSAIWVNSQELTALNMTNQPTIWVTESPEEVQLRVGEYNNG